MTTNPGALPGGPLHPQWARHWAHVPTLLARVSPRGGISYKVGGPYIQGLPSELLEPLKPLRRSLCPLAGPPFPGLAPKPCSVLLVTQGCSGEGHGTHWM